MMSTAATPFPVPPPIAAEHGPTPAQWGMLAFLGSEVAFFSTLIVAYVTFQGAETVGPTPEEVLSLPLAVVNTAFLLLSSVTIHAAELALRRNDRRRFLVAWSATILLGIAFIAGTAYEWRELIVEHHLTISRNLFGTTYYTLVGFHGLHVCVGLLAMLTVLGLALGGQSRVASGVGPELVSWYWHFVDAVWIVVFLVVYVAARSGIS